MGLIELCVFFVLSVALPSSTDGTRAWLKGFACAGMSLGAWQPGNSQAGLVPSFLLQNIGRFLNHQPIAQLAP